MFSLEKCLFKSFAHFLLLLFVLLVLSCMSSLHILEVKPFSDTELVAKLAYLCDIFNLFNKLNLSVQGRTTTVFKSADKVAAFKAKLELWGQQVNIGIFDMFQT